MFDPATGRMVITYQTFVVRTPKHTILVDTCTGEDKGYPPPMDFPKQPWLDGFAAEGCASRISTMCSAPICTSTIAAGTRPGERTLGADLPEGEIYFPQARIRGLGGSDGKRGNNPPGNVWRYNCEPVVAAGQALLVDDDYRARRHRHPAADARPFTLPLLHQYPLARPARGRDRRPDAPRAAVREPDWSTIFDWDPKLAAASRRKFFNEVADTPAVMLPIHFPGATAGRITGGAAGFDYKFR